MSHTRHNTFTDKDLVNMMKVEHDFNFTYFVQYLSNIGLVGIANHCFNNFISLC